MTEVPVAEVDSETEEEEVDSEVAIEEEEVEEVDSETEEEEVAFLEVSINQDTEL